MTERYVLLGLAPPRAEWFRAVAHWCNGASVPAEFVKCVSAEQVRSLVRSGRPFSAAVVDGACADRDLLDGVPVPVFVVDDTDMWEGAAIVLPRRFGPDHLLHALHAHASRVGAAEAVDVVDPVPVAVGRGRVVAVCGPGGTGASTVAVAVAQGLGGSVLLADLKLRAEQAILHDSRAVAPGVQELVDGFRRGRPAVREFTFRVAERGYDLLLGLRSASAWSALRPRAFEAAFDALRSEWDTVVCDVDADVEGEKECGSIDVEERNVMARTALAQADAVLVVGRAGMKGVHSMLHVMAELEAFGVGRIVPVVNRAPRLRSEITHALGRRPVFLPDRRVDVLLRDGVRLPPVLVSPLVAACEAGRTRLVTTPEPVRIVPGSLGAWRNA